MNKKRSVLASALALAVLSALQLGAAAATTWPTKPIKLVVPYPPGGPVDSIARLMLPKLQAELGQPVIVDNKAGAAGLIGITSVVQGEPDGSVFGFGVLGVLAVSPHVSKMAFKPEDVNYVSMVTQSPHVLAVNPASGIKDLKGFVEAARKAPGKLNYGSPGTGSSTHLDGELLAQEAKISIMHVPYKGGAAAINALFGDEVQMIAAEISAVLPLRDKLGIVAIMGSKRSPLLPDVPTTAELGYPNVVASSMYGIIAPTKTPPEITDKMRKAIAAALDSPDVKSRLEAQGQVPMPTSGDDYRKLMATESVKWGQMIKARNIKFD